MLQSWVAAARGPAAAEIGSLTLMLVVLGGAVFVVFIGLFVRALIRRHDGPEHHESRLLMWGGLVIPALVVSVVLGATLMSMRSLSAEAEEGALVVEITGHQWWWEVYYPEYDIRSANEIHIPVDRQIDLRLRSADVVHSFWVPALGGKLDLLPERVNHMVLEASEPDVYRGVCAEFCGLQHAKMSFHVVATSEAEHRDWVESAQTGARAPSDETATRGRDLFFEAGCQECHSIAGTPASGDVGPDLTHIASRQSIAAGSLANTTENLTAWIADPQLLKPGVEMPDTELADEEIAALVAYLETLE